MVWPAEHATYHTHIHPQHTQRLERKVAASSAFNNFPAKSPPKLLFKGGQGEGKWGVHTARPAGNIGNASGCGCDQTEAVATTGGPAVCLEAVDGPPTSVGG